MTVRMTLVDATRQLAAITDTPRLDAELLMAHALATTRDDLLLRRLDYATPKSFAALLRRRLAHEPVAYITGIRAFWTIELQVGPGALVPRPDSETLIEVAIGHFGERAPSAILDLGTGPCTLLLAALDQWPGASGVGVDVSETALTYARANADRLAMAERATFQIGDWTAGVEGEFDLILANPPYIGTHEPLPPEVGEHEPASALFAGIDGLDDYRRILPDLRRLIAPGGCAVLEIGHSQADAVCALAAEHGLLPQVHTDLGNRPRAILLT